RDYFEIPWSNVRIPVDPDLINRTTLPLQKQSAELEAAGTVLVIGGGAVGVELAAEIAETYPDKRVTLVQANKELVPGYSARLSRKILSVLKGLHVEASLHYNWKLLSSRVCMDNNLVFQSGMLMLPFQ
ncbi:TPA: hypothetical protein ACH3X1_013455, partial [Trebouxia sp. C0004]